MGESNQDERDEHDLLDVARELIGDEEPEDGWLDVDDDGTLMPAQPKPPPFKKDSVDPKSVEPNHEAKKRIPPGVGDYSKFISDGRDIRVK